MHLCRYAYMHISPIISRSSSSTISSRSSISTSNIDQVGSEIHPKSTKLEAKIVPNRSQEASRGGSWGILGGSWGQEGPKSKKCSKNQTFRPPIGGQVGSQNPLKFDLKAIRKAIIFFMIFRIDLLANLMGFWSQNGTQNPPKWVPGACPEQVQQKVSIFVPRKLPKGCPKGS